MFYNHNYDTVTNDVLAAQCTAKTGTFPYSKTATGRIQTQTTCILNQNNPT